MTAFTDRTELLLGKKSIEKLQHSHVIVFGVGGVGGFVVESLVRTGIGELTIVDSDVVSESNLNRQIIALRSTIGRSKVDVIEERMLDINPELIIHKYNVFVLPENIGLFDFSKYDYVVDCIDTVSAKLAIIEKVVSGGVTGVSPVRRGSEQAQAKIGNASEGKAFPFNIITCLGTGNKLNPMGFKVAAIEKTSVCPLAKVMRKELKERGIFGVKCVYSEENPICTVVENDDIKKGRHSPGSVSFVPGAAGFLITSEVIKDLCL